MRIQQSEPGRYPLDLGLPWEQPLANWPTALCVDMARGISRHEVCFVRQRDKVYAVKEIHTELARHEYLFLKQMQELQAPAVKPVALVSERKENAEYALLVTRYLDFSLPYRILMAEPQHQVSHNTLLDALAELLVWLHLQGIYWGDCSLSNTLFRHDAGRLSAYFVDAETARHYPQISDGQRQLDLMIAQQNFAGELMDLQAGGRLPATLDVIALADGLLKKYSDLWQELRQEISFSLDEQYKIEQRLLRLEELGYDVEEMEYVPAADGDRLKLVTKVVEPGHHIRQLEMLTGLTVQTNQARRLLQEIYRFRANENRQRKERKLDGYSEAVAAQKWFQDEYLATLSLIPERYRQQMDDAELYHQFLEHRWYISEQEGHDVGREEAVTSFTTKVLAPLYDKQ